MPRQQLPVTLAGRAFTIASARQLGLGEGRLRGQDLSRPFHGVRVDTASPPARDHRGALQTDARAASLVLPADCAFSHCTAATLLGLPLPRSHEHPRLHVMRPTSRNPVARPQMHAHLGLESRETVRVEGLRVVSAADTWVDLASLLGVEDLVVLGDSVARRAGSVDPLRAAVTRRGRVRGVRALREALDWIRVGSDSPMETRSRLLFVRHGLPEPELNVTVMARDGSGFLCRSDFVWRHQRVIGEYQGEHHFGSYERGDDDIARRLLAEDDGWKYVEITRSDVFHPARRHGLVQRLARYLGVEVVADRPIPTWQGRFATTSGRCAAESTPLSAGRRR
ncbi:hypothetical protein [Pedococcus sp.]|uniref:hypothetical protein n=1 Tax=Pedococcus sp. TaxID=2860345 RepID=UPI002E145264|nr:hypothetical protein [Pedococcus sp.]